MPHYFPYFNGGIGSQYPIRRTTRYRTVVNANDLTTSLRATDPGARRIAWWLRYQGLSDSEVASLEGLFRTVQGPLDPFVFLDPESNLLTHSEDLGNPVWRKSPGLTVAPSASSPIETEQAFYIATAPGQPGEIVQSVAAEASHRWVISVFARSAAGNAATLFLRSSNGEQSLAHTLSSQWKRYSFGGQFWSSGEGIEAGLRLNGSANAEVTGFQLETQCAASRYKRSATYGGIHPDARFSQDTLRVTTLASNCHQVALIITAPLPG